MSEEELSRRERQMMRIIYRLGSATVHEVRAEIKPTLSVNTIRSLLQILTEKGHLKRQKQGREFIYLPTKSKSTAGMAALQSVLEVFYENSIGNALATHLTGKDRALSQEEFDEISKIIKKAKDKDS